MSPTREPLVSVIIPVYGTEDYLERCVRSVADQTHRNLEIILVDDASPDGCPVMCDDYARHDARVVSIHQPNGGPGVARNNGLRVASGDYVVFVDSDDYVDAEMIENLVTAARSRHSDMALCGHVWWGNIRTGTSWMPEVPTEYDGESLLRMYLEGQVFPALWAKLYDRRLLDSVEFPSWDAGEDDYVMHEILGGVSRSVFVPKPLYHHTTRPGSLAIRDEFDPRVLNDLEVTERIITYVEQHYPSLLLLARLHKARRLNRILRLIRSSPSLDRHREVFVGIGIQLQGLLKELGNAIPVGTRIRLTSAATDGPLFRITCFALRIRRRAKGILLIARGKAARLRSSSIRAEKNSTM